MYKMSVNADEAVKNASDPKAQRDSYHASQTQKAYRKKLQEQLQTETIEVLNTVEKQVGTYENELKVLLGDNYTDFTSSTAYHNLHRNIELAAADLSKFLIDENPEPHLYKTEDGYEYLYKTTDEYMAEYEKYLRAYQNACDKYFNYLSEYATKTRSSKKSSGF